MRVSTWTLLTGALLITPMGLASEVLAQEEASATEVHGDIEAGGRVFLKRPPKEDRAKFEQYGEIPPGIIVDNMYLGMVTKDGYVVDFWGRHVGQNDQNYQLQLAKPGNHYLTFEWDQTPHLNSTKALTLFNTSNPAALKVPDGVRSSLEAQPATPAGDAARATIINSNVHPVTLNVDRETARVGLRYTPAPAWNFKFDYSHEERNGRQGFGTAINGFNAIELPAPIGFKTQNFSASGEYVGAWAAGKKWSINLAYNGSIFENKFDSFTWDNPFLFAAPGAANTANEGRNSLPPDNQAHRGTVTAALDLPFDSRYVGTVSYSKMLQNDAFMPFTINPSILASGAGACPVGTPMTNLSCLPARSLNGEVDELLVNSVLTTRFSKDLTGTARFRYLSVDNNTPLLFFPEYVRADGARQNDDRQNYRPAYNRTTSSADLNWRTVPGVTLGSSYSFERYDRDNREVDVTDEHSGKVFLDAAPKDLEWLRLRLSALHAERRYNEYDALNNVGIIGYPPAGTGFLQNPLMRKFDMADRNRNKLDGSLEISLPEGIVVTPLASWRKDEFGDNLANGGQLGLKQEAYWNAGVELAFPLTDRATVMLSYLREDFDRTLVDRQKTVVGEGLAADTWGSRINDIVHTFYGTANVSVIPSIVDLKLAYIWSHTNDDTATYPLGANNRTSSPAFPAVTNTYQRFDAVLKYNVQPEYVKNLGLWGDVNVKLHYAFERNHMTNWAVDSMAPYMIALDAGANRSLFLAALNPNYDAHILALTFGIKW